MSRPHPRDDDGWKRRRDDAARGNAPWFTFLYAQALAKCVSRVA